MNNLKISCLRINYEINAVGSGGQRGGHYLYIVAYVLGV
jgi:hypothetical protein